MRNFILLFFLTSVIATDAYGAWKPLVKGMDIGTFHISKPHLSGELQITILRINPKYWALVMIGKSWNSGLENQTARAWCQSHRLTAAINAGMFAADYSTHVGYLRSKGHVNSSHVNKYMSVAAFDPKKKGLPDFRIFDLDDSGVTMKKIVDDFSSVVQNLRLIKRPGENRWSRQNKRWSEAALGEDHFGRVLFIFSRLPATMYDLNQELLSLGIGLAAAQHLEGGPEAQLYFQAGDVAKEMFGRYENSSRANKGSKSLWPIPNVIGVRPKP